MALLYFDGFETYGTIPAGDAETGINVTTPLTAAAWSGTGITTSTRLNIGRPAVSTDPDRRSWITTKNTTVPSHSGAQPWLPVIKTVTMTSGATTGVFGFKVARGAIVSTTLSFPAIARFVLGKFVVDLFIEAGSGSAFFYAPVVGTTLASAASTGTVSNPNGITRYTTTWDWTKVNTVELSMTKADTGQGSLTLWINNAFVTTVALNASSTADLGMNLILAEYSALVGTTGSATPLYFTDMYMLDNGGDAPTTRLGKVKVVTRVPTADVSVQFTRPAGAATNASVAGQIPPSASNVLTGVDDGQTDLYSSGAFAFSNEAILATAIVTSGYKTDSGGNNIQAAIQLGGSVYAGPEVALPTGATYATSMSIFTVNPATGLKFTKAELDAAAFGVRVKQPSV